ncbi:MAG: type II toxin-antitoxin system RelE/ParE family toxin [Candidatus Hydrogenedentota bacterium]
MVPVLDWLLKLQHKDTHGYAGCKKLIRLLESQGHELRRPFADYLRDGIYELRILTGRKQYRILYSFEGKNIALLSHALSKEAKVPKVDIERAIERRDRYRDNRNSHTSFGEGPDEKD